MRRNSMLLALASASALGMVATAAERQRGRLMRAPDHTGDGPAWFYGPDGASVVVQPGESIPAGYQDHPSKVKGYQDADAGTKTAVQPANATTTPEAAAKTTAPKSQTQTDPKVSAKSGVGGDGKSEPSSPETAAKGDALDAHGHAYDPTLHAGTGTKTKAGLWRMKVGVTRPDPAPGYPLDL